MRDRLGLFFVHRVCILEADKFYVMLASGCYSA